MHTWVKLEGQPYTTLLGHKNALVRVEALPQGILWQYAKKYGWSKSIDEAKAWVEALAEHYSIPAKSRWIHL